MALRTGSARRAGVVGYAVGAIERSDPIPSGIYWIDVIHELAQNDVDKRENFTFWVQANPGKVDVLRTVEYSERTWVLFRVLEPVNRWGTDTGLGLPTIAPRGMATEESDTVQKLPPEADIFDTLTSETGIPKWALFAGGGAALAVLLALLIRR